MRVALADAKLKMHVHRAYSVEFETPAGSPHGDRLLPVIFVCYLAAALSSVQEHLHEPTHSFHFRRNLLGNKAKADFTHIHI